ncbi:family A G protein-coupled receptor-like protein [Neoconidiobolus thromboides FSU 785]|nr:family A G protein-coupled receptor-like protein [Neoconidiobolus thromboides FSU 785]
MTTSSFLYPSQINLETFPFSKFNSWQAQGVSYVFIVTNVLSLIPSLLILISVLVYKRMQTTDNMIVMQIAIIDVIYATWTIIWVSVKLSTNYMVLNMTACKVEAAISAICKITWLYSALVCAFWRYYTIVKGENISKRGVLLLQLTQWILPLFAGILIAVTNRFDLMPSAGYCYLAYKPDDPLLKGYYFITIAVILIPTVLAVYFYYSISRQFYNIMRRVNESSQSYLVDMSDEKSSYQAISEKENLAVNPSLEKYRAVAFRSIMYCLIFILSFLPYGVTMIYELITDTPRSDTVDFWVVSAIMIHKVLSPMVTLFINASILAQVKKILSL